MALHELQQSPGIKKRPFRLGRGNSARKGNYSGKGMKGQKARAGGGVPGWFEGGQTPLHMRLPKLRGFKRYFKLIDKATPVSLQRLDTDERIVAGAIVNPSLLATLGYSANDTTRVKVLGSEKISKKLQFEGAVEFSAGARAAIEAAGGSISDSQV